MAAPSSRHVALSVLLLAGVASSGHAACGLSTEGTAPPGECQDDLGCVPPDACKLGSCAESGVCTYSPVADGPPPVQIPGDCERITCAAGEPHEEIDDTDSDDGNPCTTDGCAADGTPSHEPVDDGTACGSGVCEDGTCVVPCDTSADCPPQTCKKKTCDLEKHECVYTPEDDGVPVSNELSDDCVENVCVMGVVQAVPNDAEIPPDDPCDTGVCSNAMKVYTPLPDNTDCGGGLKCDGLGNCVGCNDPSDCPQGDPECQAATCENQQCGMTNYGPGEGNPAQTPNDCRIRLCNGNGQAIETDDPNDLPQSDGNPCHGVACSGGVPSHPPLPQGTGCSGCGAADGTCVCTATGECKDCIGAAAHCAPAATCQDVQCVANTCSATWVPNGADYGDDCAISGDTCGTDGECDGAGACRLAAAATLCAPQNCTCNAVACQSTSSGYCDGFGSCGGVQNTSCGAYKCNAQGVACLSSCSSSNDCVLGFVCGNGGQCGQPNGVPCPGGGGDCASGNCVDGTCCSMASCPTCKSCSDGACGGNDPPGMACGAGQACDGAGSCKVANGQPCNMPVDCASGQCCGGPPTCKASCP